MATPASAASSSELRFTNEELLELGTPIKLGERKWSSKVIAYFSDPESKYALSSANGIAGYYYYLDRQGNVHNVKDIIGDGYYQFAPFFEGLAAVIKYDMNAPTRPVDMRFTVGYVNEKGEEVIPCQYNVIPDTFGQDYFTSRFKDGYAYVYKSDGKSSAYNISGSIAKIDKTGQIVGDWMDYGTFLTYDIRKNIQNEPIFRQLQLVSGVYSGFRDYTCDQFSIVNQWGLGMDYDITSYPITADAIVVPTYQWEPYKITAVTIDCDKLGLTMPAPATRYQSTAKLTSAGLGDLDFDTFYVTVTNPTDNYDSGTVALVLASYQATVHFVDYSLAPRESKTYPVDVNGHIGNTSRKPYVLLTSGWGAYLNADIITFSDDEDLFAYRATIPYEKNEKYYSMYFDYFVCYGQPGDNWLKNYTGIKRHDQPYQYPDITHSICMP
jgi:hypothetical protein